MRRILTNLWAIFIGSVLCSCGKQALFDSLPAQDTGITFVNRITENDTLNILDFEYVYNGGGVGIGDFNNDGLPDVYFTGNQVPNCLYINKGDFKFEDITKASGTDGGGKWCSGVAVTDINNDGWLDLYVCANVKGTPAERTNLLYVNQGLTNGVPVFKEMAEQYRLNDSGYSTHAAFFDYDNDGDLDLYVLTNKIADDRKPSVYRPKVTDGSSATTDRLYRNDWSESLKHGVFTDVSKEAGILIEGYGLGLNVCDINQDGWKDIYVTNDYVTNDLIWVNNHDGTFSNRAGQYLKHTSHSAMGNDVADINNDGLPDIIAVDMMPEDNYRKKMFLNPNSYQTYLNNDLYGYEYQYVRNTLQLNQGKQAHSQQPIFSEISMLAGIAETDWSWTPMVVDFDNDGYRDVVITNGFPKDVTDHDFIQYQSELSFVATKEILLSKIPAVKIKNYAFRNNGNLTFANVSADWGIQEPSFSNGAAYADFDNDGDLDYVVNNINDPASVYRNNLQQQKREPSNYLRVKLKGGPRNVQGLGAAIRLKYGGITQTYEHSPYRGYLSSVEAVAHFGLGKATVIDELSVVWPNGKSQIIKNVPANQVLTLDFQNAKVQPQLAEMALSPLWTDVSDSVGVVYQHTELDYIDFNIQKLIPHKLSQYGPSLAVGDVNADGLDDVFVAGSRYRKGSFLIQNNSGGFQLKDLLPEADSTAKPYEDAGSLLFDADADGDLDLYVVSGGYEVQATAQGYQDRLYLNDGKGGLVRSVNSLPTMQESGSCVKAADYDRDGDLDLFVGGRVKSTQYPVPVSSTILRNDTPRGGAAKFTNVTPQIAQDLSNIGLVCDALWTDVDADGWTDILLCGEWMPVTLLKNTKGRFVKTPTGLEKYAGLWTSLVGGDFDNDGDTDYIVGNQGHNTLYKVSAAEPMRMYAKDFDNNGNYDAIPTVYHPDSTGQRREFPYNVREDLVKQMISTRAKFPTFGQFARAGINDLLTEAERKDAMILEFNYASSSYLQNVGGGQFSISALPIEAQFAPVFGMYADDVNQDGNLDVVLVGNDFGCELLQGRQDALNGLVLSGNGAGGFVSMPLAKSGFCVPADAKSVVRVSDAAGRSTLIVSQNKGKLKFFRAATSSPSIRVEATDAVAIWKFTNGKTRRQELYYGDSFYAQSARRLLSSPQVLAVEIMDYRGNKRKVKP